MLRRKSYGTFLKWKRDMPAKTLLVNGARQIGKTYLIEEFARREFADYVKVGFPRDERASYIAQAADARDLLERLMV